VHTPVVLVHGTLETPEFQRLLSDVDGVALTSTPLRAEDIEAAPRLRARVWPRARAAARSTPVGKSGG
jgi:hypothetical protein